jgi:hypothetical protein
MAPDEHDGQGTASLFSPCDWVGSSLEAGVLSFRLLFRSQGMNSHHHKDAISSSILDNVAPPGWPRRLTACFPKLSELGLLPSFV